MTCQSIGRSPIIAIGLGLLVTPSRIRIPRPPKKRTTFIVHLIRRLQLDDIKRGDREYEPSPPRPDVTELLADLLPQVPRQDEDIAGTGLLETIGRVDRYV